MFFGEGLSPPPKMNLIKNVIIQTKKNSNFFFFKIIHTYMKVAECTETNEKSI